MTILIGAIRTLLFYTCQLPGQEATDGAGGSSPRHRYHLQVSTHYRYPTTIPEPSRQNVQFYHTLLDKQFKFPQYKMKCRGNPNTIWNIPRNITFPLLHFMLYHGNSITFGTVVCSLTMSDLTLGCCMQPLALPLRCSSHQARHSSKKPILGPEPDRAFQSAQGCLYYWRNLLCLSNWDCVPLQAELQGPSHLDLGPSRLNQEQGRPHTYIGLYYT